MGTLVQFSQNYCGKKVKIKKEKVVHAAQHWYEKAVHRIVFHSLNDSIWVMGCVALFHGVEVSLLTGGVIEAIAIVVVRQAVYSALAVAPEILES